MSAKTSVLYLGARLLSGLLSMLAISLFARGLGPQGYGWLTLAVAGGALAGGALIQPVHQSLARFLPRAGFADLLPTLSRVLIALSGVLLLLALSIEALAAKGVIHLPLGVALAAWALCVTQGVFDFSAQHANSALKPRRYAWLYSAKAVLLIALGGLAIEIGLDKQGVVFAYVLAFVLSAAWVSRATWLAAWRGAWAPDLLAQVRPYALPLAASCFLSMFWSWSDRFVLSHFLGSYDTGLYAAVADLAQQSLGLLFSALFLAWYPRMVSASEQKDHAQVRDMMSRYAALMLAVLLPSALGFSLVRANLVELFFGAAYGQSIQVLPYLSAAAALAGLRTYLLEIPLHLGGRMKALMCNIACCALVSLALNIWWVRQFGLVGAGYAAIATQLLGCALALWAGRGVLSWRMGSRELLTVLGASAALAAAVSVVSLKGWQGLLCQSLAGAVAYAAVLGVLDFSGLRTQITRRLFPQKPAQNKSDL